MQNKLNEILELCIEKSNHQIGYFFYYNPAQGVIHIEKADMSVNKNISFNDGSGYSVGKIKGFVDRSVDEILNCMQNE